MSENENLIRRFLLGTLAEEQRAQVEERLFKEDEFYREVLAVQEEMADDCVNGDLSALERGSFEDYFMKSPLRQKRIKFAAALSQALAQPQQSVSLTSTKPSFWESFNAFIRPGVFAAAAAAVILLLILSGWLWIQNRRLANDAEQARAERDSQLRRSTDNQSEATRKAKELEDELVALRARDDELRSTINQKEKELESLRQANGTQKSQSSGALAAFILSPGLTRANDEPDKLVLPNSTTNLTLQLDLDRAGEYRDYLVEIRTARGNLIWSKSGFAMRKTSYGQAVFINVPSSLIANGEYEITLKGTTNKSLEAVGYYYFIAMRR